MVAQTNNYLVFGENDLMTKEKGEVFFIVLGLKWLMRSKATLAWLKQGHFNCIQITAETSHKI